MSEEVKIEEAEGVLKGGYIPWLKEKYPFSKLTPSKWTDDAKTAVVGPSFVIAKGDNPPSVLARGRKRFKNCKFISKKIDKEGNVRVWLHPESPLPTDAPSVAGKVKENGTKTAPKKRSSAPKQQPEKSGDAASA